MIRTEILLKLAHKILELDHKTDFGAKSEEISELISEFFRTDEDVIGTENEGKSDSYYEAIRDMFLQTSEKIDEIYERNDPDNHTPMF